MGRYETGLTWPLDDADGVACTTHKDKRPVKNGAIRPPLVRSLSV